MQRYLPLLLALAAGAASGGPITLAWDASPAWPAGTTVELLVNGVTASGITSSTHTLDIELAPGAVLDAKARAVAPNGELSGWATLVQTVPDEQRDLWAARDDGEVAPPMAATFQEVAYHYRGSASEPTLVLNFATVNAGDLIVFQAQGDDYVIDNIAVLPNVGTPSLIVTPDPNWSTFEAQIYSFIATSSNTDVDITITFTGSAPWRAAVGARYSGVASATPLSYQCFYTGCNERAGPSTSFTSGTALSPGEEALVVAIGSSWDYEQNLTAQDSFTKRFDNATATSTQWILDRVTSSSTGGGTAFATVSSSDYYFGALIAFEQSAAASASLPPKSGLTAMRHILGR